MPCRLEEPVVYRLASHDFNSHPVVQHQSRGGEEEPEVGKEQADLPVQIIWKIGIVPYIQLQPYIDDDSGDKFNGGDDQGGQEHQADEGYLLAKEIVEEPDEYKAKPAREEHGDVGEAAGCDLNAAICEAAGQEPEYEPGERIHASSSHFVSCLSESLEI